MAFEAPPQQSQPPLKQTETVKLQRERKDPDHFIGKVRNNNSVLSATGLQVPRTEKPHGLSEQRRKRTRAAEMR